MPPSTSRTIAPAAARLDAERDFGRLVGGVLVALAAYEAWRGRTVLAAGLACLGAVLIVCAFAAPRALVVPNRLWMRLAHLMSAITMPILLGLVFFVGLMPVGWLRRLFGHDPLQRRGPRRASYWTPYSSRQGVRTHFEKMY